MQGHVFVVHADVTTVRCDAWLCPTDDDFSITAAFRPALGVTERYLAGQEWGRRRAVRYRAEALRTPVVLGRVGQQTHSGREGLHKFIRKLVDVIDDFVDVAIDERTVENEGLPKLALPLIGSGDGGFKLFKGDAVKTLLVKLNAIATARSVDFILCTNTAEAWSAVQAVRSPNEWALTDDECSRASALGHAAVDGRLVLFIGAGVGRDAGLPGWQALLDELDDSADSNGLLDSRDRATLIQRRLGSRDKLVRRIGEKLNVSNCSVGLTHALLASMGPLEAITTNYDRLFEAACAWREGTMLAERMAVLPYDVVRQGQPWLLKLHGSLPADFGRPFEDDIVLTRADYMRLQRQRGALFGIVQAVLMTKHLLFVGYSLNDEDFHHLVDEIREAMPPSAVDERDMRGTVLTFERSPSIELWDDLLDVVAVGKLEDGGARRLQIFLDRVAHAATSSHRHLLEPTFDGLLSDSDREIAAALRQVKSKVDEILAGDPDQRTARAAREALREFGG